MIITEDLKGWICPKCGAAVSPNEKYCPNCSPKVEYPEGYTSTGEKMICD